MTKRDRLLNLVATLSVIGASTVYAAPFLLVGVWLVGAA